MFVQSLHVFIITLQELLAILPESRNITVENMARKSGNVISAQRSMLFILIGKLTLKPVELENINVIVVPFLTGIVLYYLYMSIFMLISYHVLLS